MRLILTNHILNSLGIISIRINKKNLFKKQFTAQNARFFLYFLIKKEICP